MITREQIKEILRQNLAPHIEEGVFRYTSLYDDTIDGLLSLINQEYEWRDISIAPKAEGTTPIIVVLLYDKRYKNIMGFWQDNLWKGVTPNGLIQLFDVTHWKPLEEPNDN